MGQSKGGGYIKKDTLAPDQLSLIQNLIAQSQGNSQAAAQGYKDFLPGGKGAQPIVDQANKNFQQQTIPSIMNAFGSGAKSSSALNQALAAGSSDLNSNIASQLAQLQLGASQGLGGLGTNQAQIGAGTPQFAYLQKQSPLWQQLLLSGLAGGSNVASSYLGAGK